MPTTNWNVQTSGPNATCDAASALVRDFLSTVNGIETLAALEALAADRVRRLGFTTIAYHRLYAGGRTRSAALLFGDQDARWREDHGCEDRLGCDPRHVMAFRSSAAFTWAEALAAVPSPLGEAALRDARRVAADALVTPVRSGFDELGVCVLYGDRPIRVGPYRRLLLQGLCEAFARRGLQLLAEGEAEASWTASPTPREAQCLQLVAAGLSDPEIATALGRSCNTVHSHVESLRNKLKARSRAQLVLRATMAGLLPVGEPRPSRAAARASAAE